MRRREFLSLTWMRRPPRIPAKMERIAGASPMSCCFAFLYEAASSLLIPPLAAFGDRVPLPCHATADRPFAAGNAMATCVLDQTIRCLQMATRGRARDEPIARGRTAPIRVRRRAISTPMFRSSTAFRCCRTYLITMAASWTLPTTARHPLDHTCPRRCAHRRLLGSRRAGRERANAMPSEAWLSLRWDLRVLQPMYPYRPLEQGRTRAALRRLAAEGPSFGQNGF